VEKHIDLRKKVKKMSIYFVWIAGCILGQMLFHSVNCYRLQKKNENLSFGKAFKIYLRLETGSIVMASIMVLVGCFVLSEIVDMNASRYELKLKKESLSFAEKIRLYFKIFSVLVGTSLQGIAYLILKKQGEVIKTLDTKFTFKNKKNAE
jgi:hypothetical protein